MLTIQIPTAQNILLEYEIASVGDRLLAYLIDLALYAGYAILIGTFIAIATPSYFAIFLYILPIMFYQLLCELLLNGQSIGKKAMNIKVISMDGGKAKISQYLLRWLFRLIDITITSGLCAVVSISFSDNNQRLGDIVAGTTVIKTMPQTTLGHTLAVEVDEDYVPVFPLAIHLSDNDIGLIKEVFVNATKYNNWMILPITADKVKSVLKIESALPPDEFLLTILKDYNYLTTRQSEIAGW